MTPPPVPNLAETREMLNAFPALSVETIVTISESGTVKARSYGRDDIGRVLADLATVQGRANCYFQVNELRPEALNRKAKKQDIVSIRMLHVDIDHAGAAERLASFKIPPSLAIHSGGGVQGFWFLTSPLADIPRGERLNKAIADHLGGDNCQNADRIMRLAGTLNVPNAKKRAAGRGVSAARILRELTDLSRVYTADEIEASLFASDVPARGSVASAAEPMMLLGPDDLPAAMPEFTRGLIVAGDHLERPIGSTGATYPSRSEVVFRVVCDLARYGADEAMIVGVLLNPQNKISASVLERPDPLTYAARQAQQGLRCAGDGWPNINRAGQPLATFANALVALPRLGLRFEFDLFQNRKRANGALIQDVAGELTDDVCATIRSEVLREFKFDPGKENVRDAAHTLCLESSVHPIRDYLDGLVWDGKPRLAMLLATYLGAEDNPLHATIGQLVLIAAVRRVRSPGVKFDSILVLEGPQGSGKSTAITILAGEAHFSDQEILTLDTKAQMEAVEGIWLYELGELQGLNRTDTDRVKAFASRRVDRGRPAYARFREDRPRQTVFIGTTNETQYLRDPTGNRRFWPVRTGKIDLDALRRDRDQLWAEASHLEKLGQPLTLHEEMWPTAAAQQEARLLDDPWLDALVDVRGTIEDGVERIATIDALRALEITGDRLNPSSAKRLSPLMKRLGWDGPKNLRIKGSVLRGYDRPAAGQADTPVIPKREY